MSESNCCHEHECLHKELKLCLTCGNVYCLLCKKEWYKEQTYPFVIGPAAGATTLSLRSTFAGGMGGATSWIPGEGPRIE